MSLSSATLYYWRNAKRAHSEPTNTVSKLLKLEAIDNLFAISELNNMPRIKEKAIRDLQLLEQKSDDI